MALTTEQRARRAQPRAPAEAERSGPAAEVRCHCGSLMARLVANRLELKCRRCKRVVVIAESRAHRGWVAIPPHGEDR